MRAACGTVALAAGLSALAHGLDEGTHTRKWEPKRASYMPFPRAPVPTPPGVIVPQYVIALPNRWSLGQDVRVCFRGGDANLRARILAAAGEWFKHVNLKFVTGGANGVDCQPASNFEIRIGFGEPGAWSYVGHMSLYPDLVSNNLSSMNFEGWDLGAPAEPRFTGTVLHEFGHALGFEHEHQSPAGGCDKEFDWTKLYAYYKSAYGWEKDKVDNNVRQLMADHSAYAWSQFDPDSIMIYGSNPNFLFKGTASSCYLHDNNKLSALDIQGASVTYPSGNAAMLLGARVQALGKTVAKLPAGQLKDALSRQLQLSNKQLSQ